MKRFADHSHNRGKHGGPSKPRIEKLRALLHKLTEANKRKRRYEQ